MLKFDSGHFTRSWKHGYHDWDPAWTPAEKTVVNACVAAIQKTIPTLLAEALREMTNIWMLIPIFTGDKVFLGRLHLWISRICKLIKMLKDMETDIGTGGKSISVRKATDLDPKDQISALCEFQGSTPRWVISLNGNAADTKCHFFAAANAAKATRSMFHELTHLYGTEDKGVMRMENAYDLEALVSGRALPEMRALLAKEREFTMLGDKARRVRGMAISLPRLQAIYGPMNCWNKASFAKAFTGDPINGLVTRISDKKQGTISIIWDAQNRPVYFFNFR